MRQSPQKTNAREKQKFANLSPTQITEKIRKPPNLNIFSLALCTRRKGTRVKTTNWTHRKIYRKEPSLGEEELVGMWHQNRDFNTARWGKKCLVCTTVHKNNTVHTQHNIYSIRKQPTNNDRWPYVSLSRGWMLFRSNLRLVSCIYLISVPSSWYWRRETVHCLKSMVTKSLMNCRVLLNALDNSPTPQVWKHHANKNDKVTKTNNDPHNTQRFHPSSPHSNLKTKCQFYANNNIKIIIIIIAIITTHQNTLLTAHSQEVQASRHATMNVHESGKRQTKRRAWFAWQFCRLLRASRCETTWPRRRTRESHRSLRTPGRRRRWPWCCCWFRSSTSCRCQGCPPDLLPPAEDWFNWAGGSVEGCVCVTQVMPVLSDLTIEYACTQSFSFPDGATFVFLVFTPNVRRYFHTFCCLTDIKHPSKCPVLPALSGSRYRISYLLRSFSLRSINLTHQCCYSTSYSIHQRSSHLRHSISLLPAFRSHSATVWPLSSPYLSHGHDRIPAMLY